ncbi:hypothetical protein MLD38_003624 [Melastoma candidum]|uniref:Uncharacterized protein n=1 Tax=Melastoma candidum TaxID=119954 RepID=A0ACB9S4J7_9MYRT|nr:hypothetical protein MLD38_003624 [Melastoma candidum]
MVVLDKINKCQKVYSHHSPRNHARLSTWGILSNLIWSTHLSGEREILRTPTTMNEATNQPKRSLNSYVDWTMNRGSAMVR